MRLTPPLHDHSLHRSVPVFPVFSVLEKGGIHRNIVSGPHP
jgi:hypothetical protein